MSKSIRNVIRRRAHSGKASSEECRGDSLGSASNSSPQIRGFEDWRANVHNTTLGHELACWKVVAVSKLRNANAESFAWIARQAELCRCMTVQEDCWPRFVGSFS